MSETDDTDVLCLIPPNFFLVHSSGSEDSLLESSRTVVHKPLSCTAQVLGKLVNQVQTIENRLESLEISSDASFGLKSRPKTLDSTDSFDNNSLDRKCFTFPRRRRRKVPRNHPRDRSLTSLDSVSTRKSIPPLKLHDNKDTDINDTKSMDGDLSSIVSTPSKKTDKLLLNEIDEFLTKVESYESPDTKYKEHELSLNPDDIIKATGNYLTQKLDAKYEYEQIKLPSGRMVSSDVLDKYIYLVKSNPGSSHSEKQISSIDYKKQATNEYRNHHSSEYKSQPTSEYKSQPTNEYRNQPPNEYKNQPPNEYKNQAPNKYKSQAEPSISRIYEPMHKSENIETRSPTVRKLNFLEKDVQPTSTPKKPTQTYLDSFRPTSNKIYDRATKVLEQYKSQSSRNLTSESNNSSQKEEFKMPQMRPYYDSKVQNKLLDSIDTDLLSLSELWGERGERERAERGDSVKLEEERLKREHCEQIIQQLQKKVLEQQEKLAVAIKVDKAKDSAIAKLKEAWLRLTGSLDKAEERHRAALDKMVREVDNFKSVADDAQKKTNHFETELYKALDLAHDYQEKCKQLVSEKKSLQESMDKALASKQEVLDNRDKEIEVLRENYETVMRLNKQSTDCVRNLEDVLEKEKHDHEETKQKTLELTRKIQLHNDETSVLIQERDLLKEKVNEERARCNMLEQQLCEKQNQTSELLKRCDTLDCEAKSLRKHMELQKSELKTHYQKQLEDAVMSKLHEFQQQLDSAEREMETDARSKENAIVDTFNKQIARIEEQHKLEVNVLEEKQREEIKLYRLQLAQASEKIGLLEGKLASYRQRRGELATQLHAVMEQQWRQALSILTHPTHPIQTRHGLDTTRPDSVSTMGMSQDYMPPKVPPLTMPVFGLNRDKQLNLDTLSDNELQQYVKLLLTKPVNPETLSPPLPPPRELEEPTSDRPDKDRDNRDRKDRRDRRQFNSSKPPWKS